MVSHLDLFAGCGGFRLALGKALDHGGYTIPHYYSEIDKFAEKIYNKNFKHSENLGDVRSIKPINGRIRGQRINLITFGFPCQDLSVAGRREGLAGSRSGLFYEATRLIRELKPEVFIFENVKGLFGSSEGADFTTILREIANIGLYECQWQLLNTRWFLPQNRERIFFIGFIRGKSRQQIFPIGENNGKIEGCGNPFSYAIDANYWKGAGNKAQRTIISRTIRSGGRGTFTKKHNWDAYKVGDQWRRLTPLECERLQGFPDGWTSLEGLKDTQRYKMLGNAVSVPVAQEIFKRIYT